MCLQLDQISFSFENLEKSKFTKVDVKLKYDNKVNEGSCIGETMLRGTKLA